MHSALNRSSLNECVESALGEWLRANENPCGLTGLDQAAKQATLKPQVRRKRTGKAAAAAADAAS